MDHPPAIKEQGATEMKRTVLISILFTLLAATAVLAGATRQVAMEIPFDFTVAGQALPAGTYTIEPVVTDGRILLIANRNRTQHRMYVTTRPAEQNGGDRYEVVFHKYGEHYFLAKVRHGGIAAGREVTRSDRESEMALGGAPETVILSLESLH
jgi:hypothetical protein